MSQLVHILSQNSRSSPGYAFFAGWGLYIISMLTFLLLVPTLLALLFGYSAAEMQAITGGQIEANDAAMWMMRLFQGSNQLLTWGLVGAGMIYLVEGRDTGLGQVSDPYYVFVASLTILMSLPLVAFSTIQPDSFTLPESMAGLESWMRNMETVNQGMIEDLLGNSSLLALAGNIVTLALIPAICEELFFRGFLQRNLTRMMNPHAAVWVGAAIFSLIHLQFYGFFARLLLGVLLGYFLLGSRSLIPSMVAHFCFNLTSILLTYAAFNTEWVEPEVVLSEAYELPIGLVVVSLIAVSGLLLQYLRRAPSASPN